MESESHTNTARQHRPGSVTAIGVILLFSVLLQLPVLLLYALWMNAFEFQLVDYYLYPYPPGVVLHLLQIYILYFFGSFTVNSVACIATFCMASWARKFDIAAIINTGVWYGLSCWIGLWATGIFTDSYSISDKGEVPLLLFDWWLLIPYLLIVLPIVIVSLKKLGSAEMMRAFERKSRESDAVQ